MENEKKRLDTLLKEKGFFESREKARTAIVGNMVKVNDVICSDPSKKFTDDIIVKITGEPNKYVSRGAYKLEKAIRVFNIDVHDKVATDIGSSTGGFSDVLLQNGIKKIYCIDVGKEQLHPKIRNSDKTIVMEETDFRAIDGKIIEDTDIIVIDVSFISIESIVPKIKEIFKEKEILVVSLIKPQFECGKDIAKKYKGIIKDQKIHKNVIAKVLNYWALNGFKVIDITISPIKGGDGNIEYLLLTTNKQESQLYVDIDEIVSRAFKEK